MNRVPRLRGIVSLVLSALLLAAACEESTKPNVAPTVRITEGTTGGDPTSYLATFTWEGSDPDGVVDHYLYAIETLDALRVRRAGDGAPLAWTRIDATTGTFHVPAELPGEDPNETHDLSAFHIKAVDDDGAESVPDVAVFDAVNVVPTVWMSNAIDVAPPSYCTSMTSEWSGYDVDAPEGHTPVGYQMKLIAVSEVAFTDVDVYPEAQVVSWFTDPDSLRTNVLVADADVGGPYAETDWYPSRDALHTATSLRIPQQPPGLYLLAVRAVDAAGVATPPALFGTTRDRPPESPMFRNVGRVDMRAVAYRGEGGDELLVRVGEGTLDWSNVLHDGDEWDVLVPYGRPFELLFDAFLSPGCGHETMWYNLGWDVDPGCFECPGWYGWSMQVWGEIQRYELRFDPTEENDQHVLWIRVRDYEESAPEILVSVRLRVVTPTGD